MGSIYVIFTAGLLIEMQFCIELSLGSQFPPSHNIEVVADKLQQFSRIKMDLNFLKFAQHHSKENYMNVNYILSY